MNTRLKGEYASAISSSWMSHTTNVNQSYLGIFKRVAQEMPEELGKAIELYKRNISAHRSNLIPALYGMIVIADVNDESKKMVAKHFPETELEYYMQDGDENVSGNARILNAILRKEKKLSDFPSKSQSANPPGIHIGDVVSGTKTGDITSGERSSVVVGSSQVTIVQNCINCISNLKEELSQSYQGDDKAELESSLIEAETLLKEPEKNQGRLREIFGTMLSKTSDIASISALIIQILTQVG